ncbi:hypothetical protein VTJ49DRAFT_7646 [Mycothermus thermophilus]|uniref:Uncharacterized protein n=1 Tax=Humicola insolens TaxID=85995 RepID=A0ABR3VGI2_HUMIN
MKVIGELGRRRKRIGAFFSYPGSNSPRDTGCLRTALADISFSRRLTPLQIARLIEGLKDACWVAGRISDYHAAVVVEEWRSSPTPFLTADDYFLKTKLTRDDAAMLQNKILAAQRRFILHDLSPIRLALLALLGELVAVVTRDPDSLLEYARRPGNISERTECLLRWGTATIYAKACDPDVGLEEGVTALGRYFAARAHRRMTEYYRPIDSDYFKEQEECLFQTLCRALRVPVEGKDLEYKQLVEMCEELRVKRRTVILNWLEQ